MNEIAKKEIAKFVVDYLKNRMMINQDLIAKSENKVDFESFMALYSKYMESIEYAKEHPNDKLVDIEEEQISFVELLGKLKADLVRTRADFIVLTESQIDELMGYVKESIETYGLNSPDFYNETFFIRDILNQLVDKISEINDEALKEKYDRVKKFLSYMSVKESVGFCEMINGRISYDNNFFYISTHNFKPVCKINKEGINEITNNELDDEDLLIADKMYIGELTNTENITCIFLEKIVDGERKMKAVSYNQEIYDISDSTKQTEKVVTFEKAVLFDKLNDYFEKIGFDFLSSNIYTKETLNETIYAYNRFCKMLPEERVEMENMIEVATSWWVEKTSTPTFDSGIEGKIGENLNLLGNVIFENTPISKEKTIQKFKTILGNKIRVLLLSRSIVSLKVDYRPEGELALAIKESQLSASFPWKTSMIISKNKIEVKEGYSASFEVIYSSDKEEDLSKK